MILLNEYELSRWALMECKNKRETPEIRNLITNPGWIYKYCLHVEDREDMWSKIKDPYWAYNYCNYIRNRPELRKIAGDLMYNRIDKSTASF